MKIKILSGFILNGKQQNGQVIDYDIEELKKLKVQYQKIEPVKNEKLQDTKPKF